MTTRRRLLLVAGRWVIAGYIDYIRGKHYVCNTNTFFLYILNFVFVVSCNYDNFVFFHLYKKQRSSLTLLLLTLLLLTLLLDMARHAHLDF